jgi:hypothetical protein
VLFPCAENTTVLLLRDQLMYIRISEKNCDEVLCDYLLYVAAEGKTINGVTICGQAKEYSIYARVNVPPFNLFSC